MANLPEIGSHWLYTSTTDKWVVIRVTGPSRSKIVITAFPIELIDKGTWTAGPNNDCVWYLTHLNQDHWIDPSRCPGMKSIVEIQPDLKKYKTRLELIND